MLPALGHYITVFCWFACGYVSVIQQTQWLHTSNIVLFVTQFPEFLSTNIPLFWFIIVIIIILGISFMQCIYTYIPEINHVPREHRVAAILVLLFMVLVTLVPALTPLYLYVSTFRSMCAVPIMAVSCSSLTS